MQSYKYYMYQLKDISKTIYAFRSWDEAKEFIDPQLNEYKCVYSGEIEANTEIDALESLFVDFNINRPADFYGHSMSMSDIVCLVRDDGCDWYYCDTFGWTKITEAIKERRTRK